MVHARLVVTGRIATFGGRAGWGWSEALAIAGGRVLASGSRRAIDRLVGRGTRHLDLPPDVVVLPALTDAHVHVADAALLARQVDLEGTASLEAGLERIRAHAAAGGPADGWIEGGGWDSAAWGTWPRAAELERVLPGRRIALWSHDRHALWVSAAGLAAAGIDRDTPDPAGGAIRRDDRGEPSGVLHETAVGRVLGHLGLPGDLEAAIRDWTRGLVGYGIGGVHDAGRLAAEQGLDVIAALQRLDERGELAVRVHASVREPALEAAIARGWRTGDPIGQGDAGGGAVRLRMGWLKLFADGSLGSHTALLVEPYADDPADLGVAVTDARHLGLLATRAARYGIAPQIHAIGDRALRAALDAIEPVAPGAGPMARVEHVQLAPPSELSRFARARIAASIQPIHLRTDRPRALAAWGPERAFRDAFRIRTLLDAGATVAFGTDVPVEPVDPWPGIALAVTRRAPEWPADAAPFGAHEAVTLEVALRAASVAPAIVAGDEPGGALVSGAPADLIVVDAAALERPVEPEGPLARLRPRLVMLDGAVAFERGLWSGDGSSDGGH